SRLPQLVTPSDAPPRTSPSAPVSAWSTLRPIERGDPDVAIGLLQGGDRPVRAALRDEVSWAGRAGRPGPRDLALLPSRMGTTHLEVDDEPPWVGWRLLTLETRMESCLHRDLLGSRRRVGTARPRRSGRCERFASSARSWALTTGR